LTGRHGYRTADFDYSLPEALIAQTPSAVRGDSRLMVVSRDSSTPPRDEAFNQFPDLLEPDDLLVINTTKVRHARLLGTRPSGAPAEVLLIHPGPEDTWVAIGKPGKAMRPGKRISLGEGFAVETLESLPNGERIVRFIGGTAAEAMDRFGALPLPPYIHRPAGAADEDRYQTVYATREGSVAAPTAGLHFTEALLNRVTASGATIATIDLAVGPGTFKPVETDDLEHHVMHPESFELSPETAMAIQTAKSAGGRIWAVGTTVVRTLESAADTNGVVTPGAAETRLMITPGYVFRVVDALLTNFHLPRSTLLMLVCAFAGYETAMAAYRHAAAERYRFYSYGDAMAVL
jgi:S-adenosylmethionine:tRNA ribosyltransferase-isomerase